MAVSILLMAGCFDYEQNMILKSDGSGTVKVSYIVEKAYLDQIKKMSEAMAKQSGGSVKPTDPAETMFSKSEIEKTLKTHDSGIKMLSHEMSETDYSRKWDMEFSFADVNKLDVLADALTGDSEDYNLSDDTGSIYVRQPDGTWLYSQPFMEDDDSGGDGEEYGYEESEEDYQEDYPEEYSDEYDEDDISDLNMEGAGEAMEKWSEDMKDLVESMASHKIRVAIEFPGDVVESNATSVEGKTAVWEYTLEQMPNAPKELIAVIK